jgi:hypothetical protein
MGLEHALLIVNTGYLLQFLLAFFYVQYIEKKMQIGDMKYIRKREMHDWTVNYQVINENIRHHRNQQWYLLFFCIFVYASVFALHELFSVRFEKNAFVAITALVVSLGTLDLGVYLVLKLEFDIRRDRLQILKLRIVRGFSSKNQIYLKENMGRISEDSRLFVPPTVPVSMVLTLVLGFSSIFYFLYGG